MIEDNHCIYVKRSKGSFVVCRKYDKLLTILDKELGIVVLNF